MRLSMGRTFLFGVRCMEKYMILNGGRSTKGVMLKDNIVYRPHKKTSIFANSVLQFFERKNIPYVQRFLGIDDVGRDMFAYIRGFVPVEIGETTIEQLCEFMKIIRQLHDCSQDFTKNNRCQILEKFYSCDVRFFRYYDFYFETSSLYI